MTRGITWQFCWVLSTDFCSRLNSSVERLRLRYKSALKLSKKNLKEEAWEDLVAASKKGDSAAFWHTINSPIFALDTHAVLAPVISEDDWVANFKEIYSCPVGDSVLAGGVSCPHNSQITFNLKKVMAGIGKLANNRHQAQMGSPQFYTRVS